MAVTEQATALLAWPPQAHVGRTLNKERIYAGARSHRRLKRLFTEQVTRVTWLSKLAPLTVNLPVAADVPEIEVLRIEATSEDLDPAVPRAIDLAIPNPTVHEVVVGQRVRQMAAYKRPSDAAAGAWVVGHYVQTAWRDADAPRDPLPSSLDLGVLYAAILRRMIDVPSRDGESLRDHIARHAAVLQHRREATQLERRMHAEKQFNRRVELNAQLRELRRHIETLL